MSYKSVTLPPVAQTQPPVAQGWRIENLFGYRKRDKKGVYAMVKIFQSRGFTIIELMITLTVAAVLLMAVAPSFEGTIRNNRITAVSNDLISALNLARSEAVKRGLTVTVCKIADPEAASPACDTGADWQDGWLVFVDSDADGEVDGTDIRLRVGQPSNRNVGITPTAGVDDFISYRPSGFSASAGNWLVCLGTLARTIHVSSTGRVRVETAGACA